MQKVCKMKLNKKIFSEGLRVGQNDNNAKESAKGEGKCRMGKKNRKIFSKICFTKILGYAII